MANRTSILTEREKEVLRHVHALETSAQIAFALQIAEVSVNKRIDSARRKLGGISRRQAAVLLAQEETGEGYDNLIPAEMVLTHFGTDLPKNGQETTKSPGMTDNPSPVRGVKEGPRNALDIWQRLGIIFLSIAGLAIAASVYIAALSIL